MRVRGITPILNVTDVPASILWFEKLGWHPRDTTLDRDVALKVLPEAFTSVQRRESTLVMLGNAGGLIEPLRDDPRFADLARRISVGGF